jgi:hypothetical protein
MLLAGVVFGDHLETVLTRADLRRRPLRGDEEDDDTGHFREQLKFY